MLDLTRTTKLVDQCWSDEIVPTLAEYIPTGKRVSVVIAQVLADHHAQQRRH